WCAVGYARVTALAAYLLDRVKVFDEWLDPADELAHPARYAFLRRHSGVVRASMAGLWLLSAVIGAWIHPMGLVVTAAAAAGVMVYAGFPRGESGWMPGRERAPATGRPVIG